MGVPKIKYIYFNGYFLKNGKLQPKLKLSYEIFGKPLHSAPVVLVNHALTGNSTVCGESGWWNNLVGDSKIIDTNSYTVIAFNIPGNGYCDEENFIDNYTDFTVFDIAKLFWEGLFQLEINTLFAAIGGSLGGAIAWEMASQHPEKITHLIPIATDCKSSDWLISNILVQDLILNNSSNPIHDARIHAMLLYRTPESLDEKFGRKIQKNTKEVFEVESWLFYHGKKLKDRFALKAYKLMNYLLRTIDITDGKGNFTEKIANIQSNIHLIAVDSDLFFTASENKKCFESVHKNKRNIFYNEIKSAHGHDSFLIEYQQLNNILQPLFA